MNLSRKLAVTSVDAFESSRVLKEKALYKKMHDKLIILHDNARPHMAKPPGKDSIISTPAALLTGYSSLQLTCHSDIRPPLTEMAHKKKLIFVSIHGAWFEQGTLFSIHRNRKMGPFIDYVKRSVDFRIQIM